MRDVENNVDDVDGLVACLAVAKDQGQTEPGDARDVALRPPPLLVTVTVLTKSHS